MDKQIITFSANEQNLVRIGGEYHYSSNKVSYIGAHFDLGANWDGFDSVRAVWFTDRINGISTVLDGEGNCIVPTEVLKKKDRVFVNLVGSIVSNGELTDRLTTYPAVALVVDSKAKVDSTETAPVTPSQFEQFVAIVQDAVANIKDIVSTTLNADYTLTFVYSDGTSYTTPSIRGERGPQGADGADGTDGNGVASAVLNSNYTLTLTFTDGTSYTTPSIRGAQGPKGDPGDVSRAQLDAAVSDLKSALNYVTNKMVAVIGQNKLKKLTAGGYYKNGVFTSDSNYGYTNPIAISGGETLYSYAYNGSTFAKRMYMRYFTFYDANGNVLADSTSGSVNSVTAPSGAVSVIASFNLVTISSNSYTNLMLALEDYVSLYVPYNEYYLASDDFVTESSVLSKQALTGFMEKNVPVNLFSSGTSGYMTKDGTIDTSSNYFYTNKIPVKKGQRINVYNLDSDDVNTTISRRFLCAFNADGQAVSAAGESSSTTAPYVVPDGITEIVISVPCAGNTPATHAVESELMVCADFQPSWYMPYKGEYLIGKSDFSSKAHIPYIFLPNIIYVATGRTIEIYNKQVCINADRFHFRWVSNVGYQYKDKFQLIGTSALEGTEKDATLELYDDNMNLVWNGFTKFKFTAELSADTKILPIGDSITRAKNWLAEVYNINNHVKMVGTFEDSNVVDSSGTPRTVHHEGRSGFGAYDYITGAPYTMYGATETVHNKFYDPVAEEFSLNYYATTYGVTFDAVQIMLGTNGTTMDMKNDADYLTQMVESIRSEYPTLPILFVYMPFTGNQDGIGAEQKSGSSDGYASTLKGVMEYKKDMEVYNLLCQIRENLGSVSNILFVPISQCFSREYNFGKQSVPAIPRSSEMIDIQGQAIHPHAPEGYWQMADVLYSAYCALA